MRTGKRRKKSFIINEVNRLGIDAAENLIFI
jgi:hypothetical protein